MAARLRRGGGRHSREDNSEGISGWDSLIFYYMKASAIGWPHENQYPFYCICTCVVFGDTSLPV